MVGLKSYNPNKSKSRKTNKQKGKTAEGHMDGCGCMKCRSLRQEDKQQQEEESDADVSATGVWDSGLVIHDNPSIIIPDDVRQICQAIQQEVGDSKEISVLFKGEWTDDGFEVKNDYVIPEQEVTNTHVDYEEDLKQYRDEGYNVHVHSHPFSNSETKFSGTDEDNTNSNFLVALLMNGRFNFTDARLNFEIETGHKVRITPNIIMEDEDLTGLIDADEVEEKISSKTYTSSTRTVTRSTRGYKYDYGNGRGSWSRAWNMDDDYEYWKNKGKGSQQNLKGEAVERTESDEKQHPFDGEDDYLHDSDGEYPTQEEIEAMMGNLEESFEEEEQYDD